MNCRVIITTEADMFKYLETKLLPLTDILQQYIWQFKSIRQESWQGYACAKLKLVTIIYVLKPSEIHKPWLS